MKRILCGVLLVFSTAFSSLALAEQNISCDDHSLDERYANLREYDQKLRNIYMSLLWSEKAEKLSALHEQRVVMGQAIQRIDLINQSELDAITKQCGWPGSAVFFNSRLSAAFVVVQHADLDYQLRYLPLIEESVRKKEVPMNIFAMLEDRILIRQGKGQKYGTQSFTNDQGVSELLPVDDGEHLNERRLAIGLTVMPGFP